MNLSNTLKEFLADHKKWIRFTLILFALGIFLGMIVAFYYPQLMEQISNSFAEEFGHNPELNLNLALQIFRQNLIASLIAWLGGLLLGIAPFLVVLSNGALLGYVVTFIAKTGESSGANTLLFLALGLIPHGVLEIPAFLIAAVLGFRLGLDWTAESAKGIRWMVFKLSFIKTTQYFLWVILVLVAAAVIEVFISGKLVDRF